MNLLDNLVIMSPPRLRRSTHFHCVICGMNLEEYRQVSCTRCLLTLNEDEGMVVTGADLRESIGVVKRVRLTLKSMFLRFMRWCGC